MNKRLEAIKLKIRRRGAMIVSFQHKDNVSEEKNESRSAIYVVCIDHSPFVLTEKETSE